VETRQTIARFIQGHYGLGSHPCRAELAHRAGSGRACVVSLPSHPQPPQVAGLKKVRPMFRQVWIGALMVLTVFSNVFLHFPGQSGLPGRVQFTHYHAGRRVTREPADTKAVSNALAALLGLC
jgi:hypothetical protein